MVGIRISKSKLKGKRYFLYHGNEFEGFITAFDDWPDLMKEINSYLTKYHEFSVIDYDLQRTAVSNDKFKTLNWR